MLKRQRPSSPPLSIPSVPLVEDPFPLVRRDVKRRRVFPPSLDGKSRGWATQGDHDEDEDEEDLSLAEEQDGNRTTCATNSTEYKQVNNVLYELHTLHQHRVLFSSAHVSGSQSSLSQHTPESPQSTPDAHGDALAFKTITAPYPENPGHDNIGSASYQKPHLSHEEVYRVTQRYEDTNRSLLYLPISQHSLS
ncbi:hypothetical protein DXG01_000017 [Tephrocybe rancida]|nr:hypothetical protein DXG01_000017 [Tephrocybe rancida]